jgi:Nuclease-related domain/AAA domain
VARLIPSFVDEQTPPGEYDVFNRLSDGPHDWVVLHSLDIAPWNNRRRTEIDFLVIVPQVGLLCIEVKSHPEIYFDGERWHPASIKRSPFKQAVDAKYAFVRRLREVAPSLADIPVVHCCVFPRASMDLPETLSVGAYELIDMRVFRSLPTGGAFCADLRRRMFETISDDPQLRSLDAPLAPGTVDRLVELCVPVRRRHPDASEEIRRHQDRIDDILRQQQKPVLQLATLNERIIVSGGAGTGKTLIAMEIARRAAERGRRVALVCFNRLVGQWVQEQVEGRTPPLPNLIADRAVRTLATLAEIKLPTNASPDYWDGPFLDAVEERLTDPEFAAAARFDYLVVDEAQDILARPRLWNCLLHFLEGGIEKGRFALFGDFEHQVLGNKSVVDEMLTDVTRRGVCTQWRLTENCRNLQIVGETAVRMSGFTPSVYDGYLRGAGSMHDLSLASYSSAAEQEALLASHIKDLRAAGYRDGQITILSFCQPASSSAARLQAAGHRLVPADLRSDRTGFTSVQAFKGLDNRAIILTDIAVGEQEFHRHLFYTAMTRSTGPIRMLCHQSCMVTIQKWIMEGFSA